MANIITPFSLLLPLVLCYLSIGNVHSEEVTTKLHFHSSFAKDSKALVMISCAYDGTRPTFEHTLAPGDNYSGYAFVLTQIYDCQGNWGSYTSSFVGYTPERDGGKKDIYWKVDGNGIYLSFDNSKFMKQADWVKKTNGLMNSNVNYK